VLALQIDWLSAAYEAGAEPGEREWPPHPARAFCALVAVAEPGSADDDALRWLEAQPPPWVHAPIATDARRDGYVVTNAIDVKGAHQVHLGRTSRSRTWARALPARASARFVWPEAEAGKSILARLDGLARRVPYLGRSTSPALAMFAPSLPDEDDFETFAPSEGAATGTRLRVPYRGYLDQLRAAFDAGQAAWTTARRVAYGRPGERAPAGPARPVSRPYAHLVTLGFAPGIAIDGRLAVRVASAFKKAILSRLGAPLAEDPWSPLAPSALDLLHGHYDHADGRRQCSVLALPVVGHPNSSGALAGVAVAVSPNLETGVLRPLLQLLGFDRANGPRLDRLEVAGVGTFPLVRSDRRRTLDPSRWTQESERWDTVLPIVLDRYPRRSYTAEEAVAEGCTFAGLPRPAAVEARPAPPVAGAPFVPRSARHRGGEPPRPAVHATLHFDSAVAGPVLLGHLRHLGLGLCLPRVKGGS